MKQFFILLALSIASFSTHAQNINPDAALIEIGGETFSNEEFLHVYLKNKDLAENADSKTLEEYLDLFVNLKLKVIDAQELKLDSTEIFKDELKTYHRQITEKFLFDNPIQEKYVSEAVERSKWYKRAEHILVKLNPNPTPKDTLEAYQRAQNLLKKLKNGEEFSLLAKAHSDDPSAAKNGGDLGYFTAFQMVYPFETAVFETTVNDIAPIVRTKFGYHIVRVTDQKRNEGKRLVAHIMIKKSSEKAEETIQDIYKTIKKKQNFEALVPLYSEDEMTAKDDGVLPAIEQNGKYFPALEDMAFALQEKGDISVPFETPIGWHILKLIDSEPAKTDAELRRTILGKVKASDRNKLKEDELVTELSDKYELKRNEGNILFLKTRLENTSVNKNTAGTLVEDFGNREIFSFDSVSVKAKTVLVKATRDQRMITQPEQKSLWFEEHLAAHIKQTLFRYQITQMTEENREYRNLLKEYRDGMLFFEVSKYRIWDRSQEDTVGLQNYFKQHREDFQIPKKMQATIYTSPEKKIVTKLSKLLSKGKKVEKFVVKSKKTSEALLHVEEATFDKNSSHPAIAALENWETGISDILEIEGHFALIHTTKVTDPRPAELEEIQGRVTAAYQEYLQQKWLMSLRRKYRVQVNKEQWELLKEHYKS